MSTRQPPRVALALLERLVPDSAALAGDLIEEYGRRPSRVRVWREVLTAIAAAGFERSDEIRPLRLVDLQPSDAIDRTRRLTLGGAPVNLTGSPVAGAGGLTLIGLVVLMTFFMPAAWWLIAAAAGAGLVLGVVMIVMRRRRVG
ncbi:MAG TPA: hypothetical protein VFK57_15825 [Vicinamibacterales bacterium]|nr:hypothetical protein [Vicinamibacterales bacterium]